MGKSDQRVELLSRLPCHRLQALLLLGDEALQIRELRTVAEILFVHLAHRLLGWVLALLRSERIKLALFPLQRVPAGANERLVVGPSEALPAFAERRHDAAGPEGLRQDAVHVPEGPDIPRRRSAAEEDLLALVEQQVLECGEQVRGTLRELGDVPARSSKLETHGAKTLSLRIHRVHSIAQDSGGSVWQRLEHVGRVLELLLDGITRIELHDAGLALAAVGLKRLHPDHHGAAEAATQLLRLEAIEHLQQDLLVGLRAGVSLEELLARFVHIPDRPRALSASGLEGGDLVPTPKARDRASLQVLLGRGEVLPAGQPDLGQHLLVQLDLLLGDGERPLALLNNARHGVGQGGARLLIWRLRRCHRHGVSLDALLQAYPLQAVLEEAV
mmetsp:Transcript_92823/g.268056  ORF Transcript_92823/g.268056 Transcript_92823/m.268056 type:complete len:387 (+) Transcript_92823:442-1602(+)